MEVLSEHQCQGWLEGYLLTGRHGLFNCYEAFIHIVDSMFNQHAKWLKVTRDIPWRRPIASLNYLLSSLVWRQDHNGFSHQDPGFIDHVVNKKAGRHPGLPAARREHAAVGRRPLPAQPPLRQRHRRRASSRRPNWLSMDQAILHCTRGIGIWDWASNDQDGEPDVVMACAGDVPTLETLAAVDLLRQHLPDLKVRVVNVVDLMRLQPATEHPHGLSDAEFDSLFTTDRPVIFAYHGYPWLIHRLTYRRTNHANLHVRGLQGGGHDHDPVRHGHAQRPRPVPPRHRRHRPGARGSAPRAGHVRQLMVDKRIEARAYTRLEGEDAPEIADWTWPHWRGRQATRPRPDPRRQRGLEQPEAARPRRRRRGRRLARTCRRRAGGSTPPPRSPTRSAGSAAGRRRRPPDRPRRHPVLEPGRHRRGGRSAAARPHRPRPAPPAEVAGRPRGGQRGPAGRAGGRLLRHGLPRDDAGRRRDLRPAARVAQALGPAPVRVPRPVARLRDAAGGGAPRPARRGPADRDLPPRRRARRWPRSSGRPVGRHDDGLHAARGPGHGHPLGERRPGPRPVAGGARRDAAGRAGATLEHRSGLLGLAGTADMRAILVAPATGEPDARLALDVYVHRLRAGIAAMAASLGGLDASSSPAASASTRRPSGRWRPRGSASSGSRSTRRATRQAPGGPRDRPRTGGHGPDARHRRPRGPPDRPRGAMPTRPRRGRPPPAPIGSPCCRGR